MEDRFDRLEELISGVEQSLGARMDGVERGLGSLEAKVEGLGDRVGVLHEEVISEIRFGLEAVVGTKEQLSRQLDERATSIEEHLALVAQAVRANEARRAGGSR